MYHSPMIGTHRLFTQNPHPALLPVLAIGLVLSAHAGTLLGTGSLYPLALIAAPLALVMAWRWPGIVFALYLGIPYYKGAVDPYAPVDITAGLAVLCVVGATPVLFDLLRGGLPPFQWQALRLWLIPLLVVLVGSTYAISQTVALPMAAEFLLLVFVACLGALRIASDPRHLRSFLWTLFALSALGAAVGWMGLDEASRYDRLDPLNSGPIGVARAGMTVVLIAALFLWSRRLWRLPALFISPVALLVGLGSGSRGPLVMGALVLLVMWLVHVRRKGITAAVIGGAVVLLLSPAQSITQRFVPAYPLERLTSSFSTYARILSGEPVALNASDEGRVQAWTLSVDMFTSRPFFGWGTGSFETLAPLRGLPDLRYPHNLIMHLLAEYGGIGLLLVGGVLVVGVWASLQRDREPEAVTVHALFLFSLLNAMVSNGIVDHRILWGLLLLVLVDHARHRYFATHAPDSRR